ncbi:hypothetical protein GCM10027612_68940 [Microbispora bryophytorum subsp. camponoti]
MEGAHHRPRRGDHGRLPVAVRRGGEAAASRDLAAERAARGAAARDRAGIADEAFTCDSTDSADSTAGTTGATVWFRLSNLIVEVAYRRAGDPSVTPADRRTAERAAELVGIGLG